MGAGRPATAGAAKSKLDLAVLTIPALLKVALHLATYKGFGFFSDEFYYIACSKRLDWGYVDHPPLSILLLRLDRWLFGDSLFSIRLLPALAGGATVLLTGLLARQLGAEGLPSCSPRCACWLPRSIWPSATHPR